MEQRVELGLQCRREYLAKLAERHAIGPGATFAGVDIAVALAIGQQWRSVEQYLDVMKLPVKHRRQWGGYSEALLLSYQWNVTVGIFAEGKTGDYFLLCDPIIPPGATDPEKRICLLWKGQTHYNLLIMPPRTWAQAQRAAQAG